MIFKLKLVRFAFCLHPIIISIHVSSMTTMTALCEVLKENTCNKITTTFIPNENEIEKGFQVLIRCIINEINLF